MIGGLERFVNELRRGGVSVSPAEWVDAMRAVERLGLDDRRRFRQALRSTLVKRASQLETFDRVFEGFFAGPAWGGRGRERRGRGAGGDRPSHRGSPETSSDSVRTDSRDSRRPYNEDETREPASPSTSVRQVVAAMRRGQPHREGRWRRTILQPERDAGAGPQPAPDVSRASTPGDPWTRDLTGRMAPRDERELALQVSRIVERIRLRTGRRYRRSHRGRLYLRRVFRDNLRHGGVPWTLPFRRPRRRRSRVVLLIDVSWSVARAAGLFLSVAGEFLRRARDSRVLVFVDRAVDATRDVEQWLRRHPTPGPAEELGTRRRRPGTDIVRGGVSFAGMIEAVRGLDADAPSDYGRAFHSLSTSRLGRGGRSTTLVVLGDGRTNRFDPQDWAFEEIAARCGAVLWLVPEPLERWGTGDSGLELYLPHTDVVVEARDLCGLARGVSELVRRL